MLLSAQGMQTNQVEASAHNCKATLAHAQRVAAARASAAVRMIGSVPMTNTEKIRRWRRQAETAADLPAAPMSWERQAVAICVGAAALHHPPPGGDEGQLWKRCAGVCSSPAHRTGLLGAMSPSWLARRRSRLSARDRVLKEEE